jgi:hypothetical protein
MELWPEWVRGRSVWDGMEGADGVIVEAARQERIQFQRASLVSGKQHNVVFELSGRRGGC